MLTFRRTGLICPTKAEEIRQRISRHILIFRRLFGIICKAWRVTQVVEEAWLEIRVGSGRFLRWKSLIYKGFPEFQFQNFIPFLPVFLAFSQRTENSWDIRRAIEEVITRTTRNRLTAKNRPWVRIPRPPPAKNPVISRLCAHMTGLFFLLICHCCTWFSARTHVCHPAAAVSGRLRMLSITFADVSLDL